MSGTPKTLREAVLLYVPYGTTQTVSDFVTAGLKDFLSQRFQAAILDADSSGDEALAKALADLFEKITN